MQSVDNRMIPEGISSSQMPQRPQITIIQLNMSLEDLSAPSREETLKNQEDAPDSNLKGEDDEKFDKNNCSKEFLKFSRKLANLMIHHLQQKTEIMMKFLLFSGKVANIIYLLLGLKPPDLDEVAALQMECLERLWGNYKETMSYSKNKKICIVKAEDWGRLYSKPDFTEGIKEILRITPSKFSTLDLPLMSQFETIVEFFSSVLFYTNLIFSFLMIIKDPSDKGAYLRELKTINNFLVMMLSSDLYKNYNHRSGKFAIECCGKCKVCRSKHIPPSFQLQLERGRTKIELMKTFISITMSDLDAVSDDAIFGFYNLATQYL